MSETPEQVLEKVLINHSSDSSSFDVVAYINEIFPNEQSLASIDDVITKIESEISSLDEEISFAVQSSCEDQKKGEQALQESEESIQILVEQIQSIALQAKQSEQTVREITSNMKLLDLAKKNLSHSIAVLTNLYQLVSGTMDLESAVSSKKYDDAALHLQQTLDILHLVSKYNSVPKIADLSKRVTDLKTHLISQVSEELKQGLFNGTPNIKNLKDCCKVLEASVAVEAQEEILNKLIEAQLQDYKLIFEPSQDEAWLDQIDHRYVWARQRFAQFENRFNNIFPTSWNVSEKLAVAFCNETELQLTTVMQRRLRELDVNVLWFAILRTFEFEDWLGKKYAGTHVSTLKKSPMKSEAGNPFLTSDTDNTLNEVKKSSGNAKNPFSLLIARCFEKHMDIYVKAKSSKIHQQIEKYRTQVLKVVSMSREPGAEINVLGQLADAEYLSNATELFVTFKSCLVDFCKISTSRPLLGLINNCFKSQLKQYSSIVLLEAIPGTRGTVFLKLEKRGKLHSEMFPSQKKPEIPMSNVSKKTLSEKLSQFKSLMSDKDNLSLTKVTEALSSTENITPLTKAEVCFTCKILGTVDWCYETTLQLETKLREKINLTEEVAEKEVSFEQELSLLNQITMSAIGSLVDDLYFTCCHKVMIQAIPKVNWEGIQAAGDTSPYVRECKYNH